MVAAVATSVCKFFMINKRLDLKISLSPSQVRSIQKWIAAFKEKQVIMVANPVAVDGVLHIAGWDFIRLLGYIDVDDSNEFDIYRFKALDLPQKNGHNERVGSVI